MCPAPDLSLLSILMVASEGMPFAKTGGLAEVTSALSKALGRWGQRVTLVMPKYREVGSVGEPSHNSWITLGSRPFQIGFVERTIGDGAAVVLFCATSCMIGMVCTKSAVEITETVRRASACSPTPHWSTAWYARCDLT